MHVLTSSFSGQYPTRPVPELRVSGFCGYLTRKPELLSPQFYMKGAFVILKFSSSLLYIDIHQIRDCTQYYTRDSQENLKRISKESQVNLENLQGISKESHTVHIIFHNHQMQMQLSCRTRVTKVRVFGSNTRKNPKPEVQRGVGSGSPLKFGVFRVRKPEKS